MHEAGKSDRPVVPVSSPNKAAGAPVAAEAREGRGLAKENPGKDTGRLDPEPNRVGVEPDPKACSRTCCGYGRRISAAGASSSEARARCGSSARRDPCGGPPERAVPTATSAVTDEQPIPSTPALRQIPDSSFSTHHSPRRTNDQ